MLRLAVLLFLGTLGYVTAQRPSLNITRCPANLSPEMDWSKLGLASITSFRLDSGSGKPKQNTQVYLCHTGSSLKIKFDCDDVQIYNPFDQCNQKLYLWDVVEAFLAPSSESFPPHHYIELEVAPTGALFAAKITNPQLTCAGIKDDLIPCNATGITYESRRFPEKNMWWAYLDVPFAFIESVNEKSAADARIFHGNFFRVDLPEKGNLDLEEFSCWNPTYSDPPCFHKPKWFGDLVIV